MSYCVISEQLMTFCHILWFMLSKLSAFTDLIFLWWYCFVLYWRSHNYLAHWLHLLFLFHRRHSVTWFLISVIWVIRIYMCIWWTCNQRETFHALDFMLQCDFLNVFVILSIFLMFELFSEETWLIGIQQLVGLLWSYLVEGRS